MHDERAGRLDRLHGVAAPALRQRTPPGPGRGGAPSTTHANRPLLPPAHSAPRSRRLDRRGEDTVATSTIRGAPGRARFPAAVRGAHRRTMACRGRTPQNRRPVLVGDAGRLHRAVGETGGNSGRGGFGCTGRGRSGHLTRLANATCEQRRRGQGKRPCCDRHCSRNVPGGPSLESGRHQRSPKGSGVCRRQRARHHDHTGQRDHCCRPESPAGPVEGPRAVRCRGPWREGGPGSLDRRAGVGRFLVTLFC